MAVPIAKRNEVDDRSSRYLHPSRLVVAAAAGSISSPTTAAAVAIDCP
jgi:hypothetical protein